MTLLNDCAAFAAAVREGDPSADEWRGALLVSRHLRSQPVSTAADQRLAEFLKTTSRDGPSWEALADAGYGGATDNYGTASQSDVLTVLESRRGLPITLAVLLIQHARRQGCRAVGLNQPGHFLVEIDGRLVDPFALKPYAGALDPRAAPVDGIALALRMFNNVKAAHSQTASWHRLLEVTDLQSALLPDSSVQQVLLKLEAVEGWVQLGAPELAMSACERALAHLDQRTQDPALSTEQRQQLRARITQRCSALKALPPPTRH